MPMRVDSRLRAIEIVCAILMLGSFVLGMTYGLIIPASDAFLELEQHLFRIRSEHLRYWIFEIAAMVSIAGVLVGGMGRMFGWPPSIWFLCSGVAGELFLYAGSDLGISSGFSAAMGAIFHLTAGWLLATGLLMRKYCEFRA